MTQKRKVQASKNTAFWLVSAGLDQNFRDLTGPRSRPRPRSQRPRPRPRPRPEKTGLEMVSRPRPCLETSNTELGPVKVNFNWC